MKRELQGLSQGAGGRGAVGAGRGEESLERSSKMSVRDMACCADVYARMIDSPDSASFARVLYSAFLAGPGFHAADPRAGSHPGGGPVDDEGAVSPEAARWGIELVRSAHRLGIALAAGTDNPSVVPSRSSMSTSGSVDSVGLAPSEVMSSATFVGAAVLGLQDRLGSVETGKVADLVLYRENPTEEVTNARHPAFVIKNGELVMR